jgi:hypothetical protein
MADIFLWFLHRVLHMNICFISTNWAARGVQNAPMVDFEPPTPSF